MKPLICTMILVVAIQAQFSWKSFLPKYYYRKSSTKNQKIVGGSEAEPNSRPYQAALFIYSDGITFCGGSLISNTTILTAAHCVENNFTYITVVLGAHKIFLREITQMRVNATKIIVHPQYDGDSLANDIAIIRIPAVTLTKNIKLVPLPSRSETNTTFYGDTAVVSGWGRTSDTNPRVSNVLNQVQVRIINNFFCNIIYLGIVKDTHVCTSGLFHKGTCNGDSGGPLTLLNTGKQVGIVSFGTTYGCSWSFPVAYTRVSKYLDFIKMNSDVVIND